MLPANSINHDGGGQVEAPDVYLMIGAGVPMTIECRSPCWSSCCWPMTWWAPKYCAIHNLSSSSDTNQSRNSIGPKAGLGERNYIGTSLDGAEDKQINGGGRVPALYKYPYAIPFFLLLRLDDFIIIQSRRRADQLDFSQAQRVSAMEKRKEKKDFGRLFPIYWTGGWQQRERKKEAQPQVKTNICPGSSSTRGTSDCPSVARRPSSPFLGTWFESRAAEPRSLWCSDFSLSPMHMRRWGGERGQTVWPAAAQSHHGGLIYARRDGQRPLMMLMMRSPLSLDGHHAQFN